MKYARFIALLSALVLTLTPAAAQKKGDSGNDYNLQKAYEVLREDHDEEKALELIQAQLKDTPDNVNALLLRVSICRNKEEYGQALIDINHALKVNKPKKSKVCRSTIYWWRAAVYSDMEEYGKAEADFRAALGLARKDDKDNVQDISFALGQTLYNMKKYDESDAVYYQIIREDETEQAAMVGLARNMIAREQYQEAVDILNKAEKFDADYAQIYRFRLQAYDKLGETDKAIEDGIKYCEKDDDAYAQMVVDVMMKHYNYAVAKVKATIKKTEKPLYWRVMLCRLYEENNEYELALKEYDAIEADFGKETWIYAQRAVNYGELGMTDKAIEEVTAAMAKDPDFYDYCTRGDFYREAGRYEEAIADFAAAIEEKPDNCYGYYKRGWCYELSGDKERAMEDYNLGIDIDDSYPWLYLMRAELYLGEGKTDLANADLEQIIQRDTTIDGNSCRHYALHFLGRDDEAAEWMQKIIDEEPNEKGNYYDKACLYSRMGRYDEAVEALKKCLDLGYRSFGHLEHDDDLDPIRDREDFKEAVAAAKEKLRLLLEKYEIENPYTEERTIEVAVKRNPGGTFEVPCEINGLPLQMIFDTGASDVTISIVEANFMLKNNYLSARDVKGKKYYQVANGSLSEGTVITLHEVKIGDAVLHNVDASVVKSQKAPLLFGQSAMERFGTITIDNAANKLIIKQ